MSLSLCWRYTTDSWVYKEMNNLLRNDSPSIKSLAPYMNGLIKSYHYLVDPKYYFAGTVYRRTKFIQKTDLNFYQSNKQFIWSAFTSTTTELDPIGIFGNVLFVITIPEKYKKFALNVQYISNFPNEQEVLLHPNIGFTVTGIEQDPTEYQNCNVVIHVVVSYICTCTKM